MRSTHFIASCAVAGCISLASTTMAQATGACCIDPDAGRGSGEICLLLTEADCSAYPASVYHGDGSDCAVCFGGGGGACCFGDVGGECVAVFDESACQEFYQGDGTSCIPNQLFNACPPPPPPDMPAVSQWGVATLVLLILAGITIKFATTQRRA